MGLSKIKKILELMGCRGVLSISILFVFLYFSVQAVIYDGWISFLSILIGGISCFILVMGLVDVGWICFILIIASIVFSGYGFISYLDNSMKENKKFTISIKEMNSACIARDHLKCERKTKEAFCHYMNHIDYLSRAAQSADINLRLPKELSGVVEFEAMRQRGEMPDCSKRN